MVACGHRQVHGKRNRTPELTSLLAVLALLFAGCTIKGPPPEPSAGSSSGPTAPRQSLAQGQAVEIEVGGERASIQDAADCGAITMSSFYQAFCVAVATPDWRSIPVSAGDVGPTPQMMARLIRAAIQQDVAICSDPLTFRYIQAGSRSPVDAASAKTACETSLKDFATNRGTTVFDYSATDNSHPLRVVMP